MTYSRLTGGPAREKAARILAKRYAVLNSENYAASSREDEKPSSGDKALKGVGLISDVLGVLSASFNLVKPKPNQFYKAQLSIVNYTEDVVYFYGADPHVINSSSGTNGFITWISKAPGMIMPGGNSTLEMQTDSGWFSSGGNLDIDVDFGHSPAGSTQNPSLHGIRIGTRRKTMGNGDQGALIYLKSVIDINPNGSWGSYRPGGDQVDQNTMLLDNADKTEPVLYIQSQWTHWSEIAATLFILPNNQ
jgi:hypothetical protein